MSGETQLFERQQELGIVTGFIKPIFSDDVIPGREQRHGLARDDYMRVIAGYACGKCLATFDIYVIHCPVCGFQRDLTEDLKTSAPDWESYLRARKHALENPVTTRVPRMHEVVDAIMDEQTGRG